MIVFRPLADDSLCAIAEKMLCQLEQRAARSGYQLHHTPRVGQALAAKARSAYGARELRRAVDRAVEQALADRDRIRHGLRGPALDGGLLGGWCYRPAGGRNRNTVKHLKLKRTALSYKTRGGIFCLQGGAETSAPFCAYGAGTL